jgi:hypothetical protein
MGIVSEAPIVLIGPGSEWFWSMAQFVVVAVTLVGIYYQFRLQRSANAFEQVNRIHDDWFAEPLLRARISAGKAARAGQDVPLGPLATIGNFWESVASLVRRGHVDGRVVYESLGNSMRFWWSLTEEQTLRHRLGSESSDLMVHFEWLAKRFAQFAERDGTTGDFSRATLVAELDDEIPAWEDRLRILEASRALTIVQAPRSKRGGTNGERTAA